MARPDIGEISPFFVVSDVPSSLAFYRDRLGFEVTFQGPSPDDIFFGIVRRGGAQILLRAVGVAPVPNHTRDVQQGVARWDAYVYVPDPDALFAEFTARDVACAAETRRVGDWRRRGARRGAATAAEYGPARPGAASPVYGTRTRPPTPTSRAST